MDSELFRWVLLGLLGVGIVVLIALLAVLGGIRKALEQRQSTAPPAARDEPVPHAEAAPVPTGTTEAETDRPADTSVGRTDSIRSVLQQHGLSETADASATGQDPAVTAHPTPDQIEQEPAATDSVFAAHADDPQDEPFQRDGRWWFRRGDELLLYDEASGQWQPAPDTASGATPPAAQEGVAGSPAAQTGVQTTPVSETPVVADQVSTFWKCPTCGAVNGSTAATCRMCFAARP